MDGVLQREDIAQATWPGFTFIFFDCDSTLSTVEGIDELARRHGKFDEIKRLTDAAMQGEVHLQSVYDRRLQLLRPTRAEIRALEQCYRKNLVPDTQAVLQALQAVHKQVFIVSGGLLSAVRPFGMWLGVPAANIRAVELHYNSLSGQWWNFERDRWGQPPDVEFLTVKETPLTESHGKADVVRELLRGRQGRALLIGDGVSDLAAAPAVDIIVGFGGVVARPKVMADAHVCIHENSLAPLLPLALSHREQSHLLTTQHAAVVSKGRAMLPAVTFRANK